MKTRHAAALVLVGWYLTVLGAGCLVIVVLTHVCERIHVFPVGVDCATAAPRAAVVSVESIRKRTHTAAER